VVVALSVEEARAPSLALAIVEGIGVIVMEQKSILIEITYDAYFKDIVVSTQQ